MWNYSKLKEVRSRLESLSADDRNSLTWEAARSYLRFDTLALAAFAGEANRNQETPFRAVCMANGFYDLAQVNREA